jgi:hypothetical protein
MSQRPVRRFNIVHADGTEGGVVTGRAPAAAACKAGTAALRGKNNTKAHVRIRETGTQRTFAYEVSKKRQQSRVGNRVHNFTLRARSLNPRGHSSRARSARPRRW